MKRMILALALCAAPLAACQTIPTVPTEQISEAALKTAVELELSYKMALVTAEAATDAGFIKGATAVRVQEIRQDLRNAFEHLRHAKANVDAADYAAALIHIKSGITALNLTTDEAVRKGK